jgi:hypothetical protein
VPTTPGLQTHTQNHQEAPMEPGSALANSVSQVCLSLTAGWPNAGTAAVHRAIPHAPPGTGTPPPT